MAARLRFERHSIIMLCFCAADVAAHLAIVLGAPRFEPEAFQMLTQTACIIAWIAAAPLPATATTY